MYNVPAYVSFNPNPVKRSQRAEFAKSHFDGYKSKQRVFLDFVLQHYVESGVSKLEDIKLPELLTPKYNAITDVKKELGEISSTREAFIGFQAALYEPFFLGYQSQYNTSSK